MTFWTMDPSRPQGHISPTGCLSTAFLPTCLAKKCKHTPGSLRKKIWEACLRPLCQGQREITQLSGASYIITRASALVNFSKCVTCLCISSFCLAGKGALIFFNSWKKSQTECDSRQALYTGPLPTVRSNDATPLFPPPCHRMLWEHFHPHPSDINRASEEAKERSHPSLRN